MDWAPELATVMRDPHDTRDFLQFVKLNPDGTVAALVMQATGSPTQVDGVYADVTELYPKTLDAVKINPLLVSKLTSAATLKDAVKTAAAALIVAVGK